LLTFIVHLLDKYNKIYKMHGANYVKINSVFGESEENHGLVQVNHFPSRELNPEPSE